MTQALPERDFFQSVQTQAEGVANGVATAIPGAISRVQSAANAAATAIPDAIKASIPRNCSLGTKQICIGFTYSTACNNLPLTLSDIVPNDVESFLGDQLQPLDRILKKVSPAYIQ